MVVLSTVISARHIHIYAYSVTAVTGIGYSRYSSCFSLWLVWQCSVDVTRGPQARKAFSEATKDGCEEARPSSEAAFETRGVVGRRRAEAAQRRRRARGGEAAIGQRGGTEAAKRREGERQRRGIREAAARMR